MHLQRLKTFTLLPFLGVVACESIQSTTPNNHHPEMSPSTNFIQLSGPTENQALLRFTSFGGISSGGGGAIVCRNALGRVEEATSFDLHEGRTIYNLAYSPSQGTMEENLEFALNSAPNKIAIRSDLQKIRNYINQHTSLIEQESYQLPTADIGNAHAPIIPVGCHLELVAHFGRDGNLRISQEVYNHLSTRDQAALVFHEITYALARMHSKDEDSIATRHLVAQIFSRNNTTQTTSQSPTEENKAIYALWDHFTWDSTYNHPLILEGKTAQLRIINPHHHGLTSSIHCLNADQKIQSSFPDQNQHLLLAAEEVIELPENCSEIHIEFTPITTNDYETDHSDTEGMYLSIHHLGSELYRADFSSAPFNEIRAKFPVY